jgi:5-methyltetrahydrofolate--homocysteine methyltransferase
MTGEQILAEIFEGVVSGNRDGVPQKTRDALDAGLEPEVVLQEGMVAAMNKVGALFEEGEYFVPEMLLAARTMQVGMEVLKPHLVETGVKARGRIVAGTVQGDLHDIGKNLVCMMWEGAGFDVLDLGTDVSPAKFLEAVRNDGVDVVAMSALLTTTMINMESVIHALAEAGLRDRVKVVVGGAPITSDFTEKIGADGYAPDASRAVRLVSELLSTD